MITMHSSRKKSVPYLYLKVCVNKLLFLGFSKTIGYIYYHQLLHSDFYVLIQIQSYN